MDNGFFQEMVQNVCPSIGMRAKIENALNSFKIIADAKKESDMFIPYKDKYIYVNGKKTKGEIFSEINKKGYFGYSSYSGLPLEDNWTRKQNKINDLVFRCYLIDNYINAIK